MAGIFWSRDGQLPPFADLLLSLISSPLVGFYSLLLLVRTHFGAQHLVNQDNGHAQSVRASSSRSGSSKFTKISSDGDLTANQSGIHKAMSLD
jgi:hypothetical protein